MSVTIRLSRHGAKKRPFYRIVVADSRYPTDGRYVELVGTYDPKTNPPQVKLQHDKVAHWLARGARPTSTVASLLKRTPAPPVEVAATTLT
ncbi:MAG: small subunit ribosomal protein [Candidatus Binatota bacterium]|jgi:small subunit ribosomal protein S16|nr:small subunit ribosomal protein [Candidatus Binatota bacterium]